VQLINELKCKQSDEPCEKSNARLFKNYCLNLAVFAAGKFIIFAHCVSFSVLFWDWQIHYV